MIPLYYYNHYLNCCVVTLDLPHLPASASASASVVPLMMDLVPQFELTAGAGCRLQATTGWRVLWLPETTLFYPHLYWRAMDLRLRGSRIKDEVGFGGVSDEVRSVLSGADLVPLIHWTKKPLIIFWCCILFIVIIDPGGEEMEMNTTTTQQDGHHHRVWFSLRFNLGCAENEKTILSEKRT